jgi:hypothetical protein
VADEAIHVNTRQGDVCDEHFHSMSDVKNNLPLYSVLNTDQAELNAAAAPTDSSEWLQHKIETAKQECGRLTAPKLEVRHEEGDSCLDKSRALIDAHNVDQALRVSASRLGIVHGPQLVSALLGDTALIQVTPPLQLRIEDGGCVGLRAEYKALPGFEVTGCLCSSSIPWSPCLQKRLAAPGVAVGAAVGNEHRENVSGKRASEGEGRGEYASRGRVIGRHFGHSLVDRELFWGCFDICKISHFFGRTLHSLRKRGRKFWPSTSSWNRNIQLEHFRRFHWRFGRKGG